jgi:hypothetical protein
VGRIGGKVNRIIRSKGANSDKHIITAAANIIHNFYSPFSFLIENAKGIKNLKNLKIKRAK